MRLVKIALTLLSIAILTDRSSIANPKDPTELMLAQSRSTTTRAKSLGIREYFLDLPNEYLPFDRSTRTNAIDSFRSDFDRNYLEFTLPLNYIPKELHPNLSRRVGELTLFKRKNGNSILALNTVLCNKSRSCSSNISLLEKKQGTWKNITQSLLPTIGDRELASIVSNSASAPKLTQGQKMGFYYGLNGDNKINILHNTCMSDDCMSVSVLKTFAWNGRKFVVYNYPESP
jgi:hypothetical protein